MPLPILQVTFTLIPTKVAHVMQLRSIVTSQEEDQPAFILFTLRYILTVIQINLISNAMCSDLDLSFSQTEQKS